MNKSEELLELIQSMSAAEKVYFKRYANRFWENSNRKSIILFKQLIKTGSADINKNKKKNKPELQKHLPTDRNRLYELILDSLQSFYASTSIDKQVYDLLGKVEVLHNRGFFEPARKKLSKARKLAQGHEKYDILIGINQWEKRIIYSSQFEDVKEKELHILSEAEKSYIMCIDEVNEHWKLASVFYLNLRITGRARTAEEKKFYDHMVGHSLLKTKEKLLSAESEMYKKLTLSRYTAAISSFEEFDLHAGQLKELMEKEKFLIYKNPFIYCIASYNYLFALITFCKFKEFYVNLSYYKNIPALFGLKQHKSIRDFITSTSINMELNVIMEKGEYIKGIALSDEVEPLLGQWKKTNPIFAHFILSNIASCFFGEGHFREALEWHNKKEYLEESFLYWNRLFELMLHFELGNNELLFSKMRSLYRYLLSRKTLYKPESLLIDFFRKKIRQSGTRGKQVKTFTELRDDLVKLMYDPREKETLPLFDLVSWLESKIENRPMKEIVREKSGYGLEEGKELL